MATSPQQVQCPGLMIGMVCMKYEHLVNFHICVFFLGTLDKKLIENNLETRQKTSTFAMYCMMIIFAVVQLSM